MPEHKTATLFQTAYQLIYTPPVIYMLCKFHEIIYKSCIITSRLQWLPIKFPEWRQLNHHLLISEAECIIWSNKAFVRGIILKLISQYSYCNKSYNIASYHHYSFGYTNLWNIVYYPYTCHDIYHTKPASSNPAGLSNHYYLQRLTENGFSLYMHLYPLPQHVKKGSVIIPFNMPSPVLSPAQ